MTPNPIFLLSVHINFLFIAKIISMIYVGGVQFVPDDASQVMDVLIALMEHPALISATNSFKSIVERKISISERPINNKLVYIFQREYATVDPALVDLVGTDEATTCIGIIIRNRNSGMVSVAHMDFPYIVDDGLDQMLSLVTDEDPDTLLDVHMVGGFVDIASEHSSDVASKVSTELEGYSYQLCAKIIGNLSDRSEKFHIQTMHVLGHNTRWDSEGIAYPIFHGFVVETSSGSIIPASFDNTSRCPDEVVRRIRVTASFQDPNWRGRLLETYDTKTDSFGLPHALGNESVRESHIALELQKLSDTEILHTCSTSPYAESPDFVHNKRRKWEYLIGHPGWRETFPSRQPRVFKRTEDGRWVKV